HAGSNGSGSLHFQYKLGREGGHVMELMWYGVAAIPVIIALVRFFTNLGVSKKAAPIVAVIFGVVIHTGIGLYGDTVWMESVFQGMLGLLVAMGVYSEAKTTKEWVDGQ